MMDTKLRRSAQRIIVFQSVCHAGDAMEPVITIMLPNEDGQPRPTGSGENPPPPPTTQPLDGARVLELSDLHLHAPIL